MAFTIGAVPTRIVKNTNPPIQVSGTAHRSDGSPATGSRVRVKASWGVVRATTVNAKGLWGVGNIGQMPIGLNAGTITGTSIGLGTARVGITRLK